MHDKLPPSPFRSVWTFLLYCLTLSTPIWKLLSYLGNIDLIADYADSLASFLDNPFGMWVPVIIGFSLLVWINHKERRGDGKEDEDTPQVEQESPESPQGPTQPPEQAEQLKARLEESEREKRLVNNQLKAHNKQIGRLKKSLSRLEIEKQQVEEEKDEQNILYEQEKAAHNREGFAHELTKLIAEYESQGYSDSPTPQGTEDWMNRMRTLLDTAFGPGTWHGYSKAARPSYPYKANEPFNMHYFSQLRDYWVERKNPGSSELLPDFDIDQYREWLSKR